jgi:hypothetical protein
MANAGDDDDAMVDAAASVVDAEGHALSPKLRALVYLHTVRFVSFEHSAAAERCWLMSSIKEPRAARLLLKAS